MTDTEVLIDAPDVVAEDAPTQRPSSLFEALSWSKIRQLGFSLTDQVLAVGGMFLANTALARAQSKEEYGMFALSYSVSDYGWLKTVRREHAKCQSGWMI